jgi:hypothetical protein
MKYAVEIGSSFMIYVPSVIEIHSAIQKLIRKNTATQTEW